jgi:hypothetical protein
MIPPLLMTIRIRMPGKRGFALWLPLFALWLLLAVLSVPLIPLVLLADFVLAIAGSRISVTGVLLGIWRVFCELRGLRVEVANRGQNAEVVVVCK